MVKAVALGDRWRKLLETGVHVRIEDIAVAEMISPSHVSRVVRLTLLAPTVVDAMISGGQKPAITLTALMKPPLSGDCKNS